MKGRVRAVRFSAVRSRTPRRHAVLAVPITPVVLAIVAGTAGLGMAGWIVGLVTGCGAAVAMAAARERSTDQRIFPADRSR